MYCQEPRSPNAEETRLTEAATHIASIAIERQQGDSMLREREARISLAAEAADLAIWVLYPERNTVWMSEKGRAMYGFNPYQPVTPESLLSRIPPHERAGVQATFQQPR